MKRRRDVEEKVIFEGSPEEVSQAMKKYTRRSIVWSGVALAGTFFGLKWLNGRDKIDRALPHLRAALETNESIFGRLFSPNRLVKEYPLSTQVEDRVNGSVGLSEEYDPTTWQMTLDTGGERRFLTIDDVRALPQRDVVMELRCIEGWSAIMHWSGVQFSEFVRAYAPGAHTKRYVALETPNGGYYVGLDMQSAMHPQTMLAYELNGSPLSNAHGAPLRLLIPVKYGVKSLKRIGTVQFTDERPSDYWAERGYDWYLGL